MIKDIEGYEGIYQISSEGDVISLERSTSYKVRGKDAVRYIPERILKPQKDAEGYTHVRLCKDRRRHLFKVHRLVAKHFLDGFREDSIIRHISTDRSDNRVENLFVLNK